jgi:hypothetical protein
MIVEAKDPSTGKAFSADAEELSNDDLNEINSFNVSETQLKATIDKLNISADAKSILFTISKTTIKAGKYILKIGRKILDIIGSLFKLYPETGFGLILGGILGVLITSIPIIGFVLGPIVGPLLAAFGLVIGLHQDISNKALAREIAKANQSFAHFAG